MLGIAIMMSLCDQVDIYKFLPSKRKTDMCYYYQRYFNSACTMGAYHPLLFEKTLVKHLNLGKDEDIYLLGKAALPGFQTILCGASAPQPGPLTLPHWHFTAGLLATPGLGRKTVFLNNHSPHFRQQEPWGFRNSRAGPPAQPALLSQGCVNPEPPVSLMYTHLAVPPERVLPPST